MSDDKIEYLKPEVFADLLWDALRSDANPEQRDAAARKVCGYVVDLLQRIDTLEEDLSNLPEPIDPRNLVIGMVRP